MQAFGAVAVAPWRVEFREVSAPEPGPEDLVLDLIHSWISNGTEGSFVRGERIAGDTPLAESDPAPFPLITGYQKVGRVREAGPGTGDFRPGEVVFATVSRVNGMFFPAGGHVSPAVTHVSQVWRIPDGLDPLAVSGLVLTQVGWNTAMRGEVGPGDAAVVLGDGMVGHWAAQTLRSRGARVMLVGKHPYRLERFRKRPEDRVVCLGESDPVAVARDWAPEGVQFLAHTMGSVEAIEAFYPVMRRFSHISSAGFLGHGGGIDIQKLRAREMTLHAVAGWTRDRMDGTLELLAAGGLETLPLITHRFPADEAAGAFDLILNRREPVLGVVLDWIGKEAGDR